MPSPPARRSALALVFATLALTGCPKRPIPARGDAPGPERFLTGGERVFEDRFDRPTLGPAWQTDHAGWTLVDGWLHATQPENAGVWLTERLPEGPVRVEFTARAEAGADGKFPGDLKCEIFAEEPRHQGGYILINGGWNNTLDVIARKDEHGQDRLAQTARPVLQSTAHRWAIVRVDDTLHWFRDGELLMSYTDPQPILGRYFGLNDWATNAYFDDVVITRLPAR